MKNMETTQHNVDDAVVRFNLEWNGLGGVSEEFPVLAVIINRFE